MVRSPASPKSLIRKDCVILIQVGIKSCSATTFAQYFVLLLSLDFDTTLYTRGGKFPRPLKRYLDVAILDVFV